MAVCPRCNVELRNTPSPHGIVFQCPMCGGRALGIAVLRRMATPTVVRDLWVRAHEPGALVGRVCPICLETMVQVPVATAAGNATLGVCSTCQFVWCEGDALEQLPPLEHPQAEELPEHVREQIALAEIKQLQEREDADTGDGGPPEEEWKWIPDRQAEQRSAPSRCASGLGSALAHLGGCVMGIAAWLMWRLGREHDLEDHFPQNDRMA
jgi:Zn-finger nucleic acid-binding protein